MTLPEFVSLSAALTGYPASILQPGADTQLVAEQLLGELNNSANEIPDGTLEALTVAWNNIAATPSAEMEAKVQSDIMENPQIARLAQNIILMWYLGNWYDLLKNPNCFVFPESVPSSHKNLDHVVSSTVYTNGLVWGEMGAHPMGFSTGNFGYWDSAPTLPLIN